MKTTARLRFSPNYSLSPSYDGQVLLVEEAHPYRAMSISEHLALLAAVFLPMKGLSEKDALVAFAARLSISPAEARASFEASVAHLRSKGVLIEENTDLSIYTASVARGYARSRAVPDEIAAYIAGQSGMTRATRVLDLATGTGSLAIALARRSHRVAGMEISAAMLAVARDEGNRRRVPIEWIHDSCNRLRFRQERYDVVTLCQALDWVDHVAVGRGLSRVLSAKGRFFCVVCYPQLDEGHPLLQLEQASPVQHSRETAMTNFRTVQAHLLQVFRFSAFQDRSATSLEATDEWLFEQRRLFDLAFAESYFTNWHRGSGAFDRMWPKITRELSLPGAPLGGVAHWGVLGFAQPGMMAGPLDPRRGEPRTASMRKRR